MWGACGGVWSCTDTVLRKLISPFARFIHDVEVAMSQPDSIFLATLAEQAERYEDMADYMKKYMEAEDADVVNSENRNLLSVAYKNVVGSKRSSWRIITNEERKCTDEFKKQILSSQREKVEEELKSTCKTVLVRNRH